MTNTPEQAIKVAANQSANGPKFGTGLCLRQVRICYNVAAQAPDASGAWWAAKLKHKTTDTSSIPRGVPVFWVGGSAGHGHIAIATGNGYCWSTDINRPGYFDHVPISRIQTAWGMTLVGWTEDLNGVRVYTPPVEKPLPPKENPVLTRVRNQWRDHRTVTIADLDQLIKAGHQPDAQAAKDWRNQIQAGAKTFFEEVD